MWTFVWFVTTFLGGHDGLELTDRLTPKTFQGNPWGPAAYEARRVGTLPLIKFTPEMKQWQAWGKTNLRDGDILFRRGDARLVMGYFPFSKFLASVTNSRFSHTGQVGMEDGEPYVYDMTYSGVRRQALSVWILDNIGPFAVKRIRSDHSADAAKALAFCQEVYRRQVPFDFELHIDDRAFYCIELTEKCYRAAGVPLSEPVLLGDMERASEYPICMYLFQVFSPLRLDQPVFFPGNDRHGIWSCPLLETVYESPATNLARATSAH